MSYGDKRSKNNRNSFWHGNRHSLIVMINAAAVLIIVIIAMGFQLARISRGKEDSGEEGASQAAVTSSAALPAATGEIERTSAGADREVQAEEAGEQEPVPIREDLDPDKPMVALTFDDGPFGEVTERLVKTLKANDSRATFFVVGNRIARYSSSLKKVYKAGNQIATHTYDHGDLSKMKRSQIRKELKLAARETRKVTGTDPTMLRPPYGTISQQMRDVIKLPMIYWNVDTEDWSSRNKKKILQRCKGIKDGDIILMHELYQPTADAVAALVPKMRKKGYQFVTVEELFYYKGIKAKGGKAYYSGLK